MQKVTEQIYPSIQKNAIGVLNPLHEHEHKTKFQSENIPFHHNKFPGLSKISSNTIDKNSFWYF